MNYVIQKSSYRACFLLLVCVDYAKGLTDFVGVGNCTLLRGLKRHLKGSWTYHASQTTASARG